MRIVTVKKAVERLVYSTEAAGKVQQLYRVCGRVELYRSRGSAGNSANPIGGWKTVERLCGGWKTVERLCGGW